MASNHLDMSERLRIGKKYEGKVISLLNKHRPVVSHTIFDKWELANETEDKLLKIDAWATSGLSTNRRSVQIKYRESGGDLGIAMIRPYESFESFMRQYNRGDVPWDRDFIKNIDLYACLMGDTLCVADGEKVRRACNMMLDKFIQTGGFHGRNLWFWPNYAGAELRLVQDKGGGYSEGQKKVICYITPQTLQKFGAYVAKA